MDLWVCNLGLVDYREALALQERVRAARIEGRVPDVLLVLSHPPVYTRGRRSGADELPFGADWYRERGIEIVDVDRGGKITYHGPGQLVGYPIVGVSDVVGYVRLLERAIVRALAEEGVRARDRAGEGLAYTGVWVDGAGGAGGVGGVGGPGGGARKIASIGVHVAHGVTTHGFAVNVVNDLAPFGWVVACGLPEVSMTSVAVEKGLSGAECAAPGGLLTCFRKRMTFALASELGLRQRLVTRDRLLACLGEPAAV